MNNSFDPRHQYQRPPQSSSIKASGSPASTPGTSSNPTSKSQQLLQPPCKRYSLTKGDNARATPIYITWGLSPRLREMRWEPLGGPKGDGHECGIVLLGVSSCPSLPPHGFVFPIIFVAGHVAALIADRCVMDENGYAGGWAPAGPRKGSRRGRIFHEGRGLETPGKSL